MTRVLCIDAPHCDYSADMTRHGLVAVLGRENVTTINPHAGALHWATHLSEAPTATVAEAADVIRNDGYDGYDLVLALSTHEPVLSALGALIDRVGRERLPKLGIIEGSDAPQLPHDVVHRFNPQVLFKRELHQGDVRQILGTRVEPLLFAAPTTLLNAQREKDLDVVFLGGESHLQGEYKRQMAADLLAAYPSTPTAREEDFHRYLDTIARARIAVSMRGFGWETTRSFEIMACKGTMLVVDRSPLVNPFSLVDGVHCGMYSTPAELAAVVARYLADEPTRARIADAGHAWMKEHHTTAARARQLLAALGVQS